MDDLLLCRERKTHIRSFAGAAWLRRGGGSGRAGSRRRPGCCGSAGRRARLHPALEGLDDAHAPAAARTGLELIRRLHGLDGFRGRRYGQQFADAGDVGLACRAGEQPVVSDGRHFRGHHAKNTSVNKRGFARVFLGGLGVPARSAWFETSGRSHRRLTDRVMRLGDTVKPDRQPRRAGLGWPSMRGDEGRAMIDPRNDRDRVPL